TSLAIQSHLDALVNISGSINVEVAIAGAGFNGWHRCTSNYGIDQSSATAWNDQINQSTRSNQILDRIMCIARQQLDCLTRNIKLCQGILQDFYQLRIGIARRLGT